MLEREGEGWRLAWDAQREPFPVLIGGEGWASELTASEAHALQRALLTLLSQHRDLANTLMEEESIGLEFHLEWPVDTADGERARGHVPGTTSTDGGALWAALEGDRRTWSLRFVLQPTCGRRGLEGFWAQGPAASFLEAFTALALAPHQGLISPDP